MLLPSVVGRTMPLHVVPCERKGIQPAFYQGIQQLPLSPVTQCSRPLDAKLKSFMLQHVLVEAR